MSCFSGISLEIIKKEVLNFDFADNENNQIISCKKATVRFNRLVTFQVDGELIGKVLGFEVGIIEKAVTVIVKKGF